MPPRVKNGKWVKNFTPEKKVIMKSMVDAGYTDTKVAEAMGCSRWAVRKAVKEFDGDMKFVTWYKENRSNVLAKVQMDNLALHEAILGTMDEKAVNAMTANEKAAWVRNTMVNAGIAYDKERLENDLSTENVDKRLAIIMQIKEDDKKQIDDGRSSG